VNFGFNFDRLENLHKPVARGCLNRAATRVSRTLGRGSLKGRL
jgi:hypothetical protein